MRLLKPFFFLFSVFLFRETYAQETSPMLTGNVNISIKKGTIECEFTLSDLPDIDVKDCVIRLNSGMNIRYFRDTLHKQPLDYDVDLKDTLSSGESFAYYLHENLGNKSRCICQNRSTSNTVGCIRSFLILQVDTW